MAKTILILPAPVSNQLRWDFAAPFMQWWMESIPNPLIPGQPGGLLWSTGCGRSDFVPVLSRGLKNP